MTDAPAPAIAVVDTCVLLAAYNRKDDNHAAAVTALNSPRLLVVSPLVLAELDHLLTDRAGERSALEAVIRIGALARTGHIRIAAVDGKLLSEAEGLMSRHFGQSLGLADTINAALAWRLHRPVILTFDHHYSDVLAPRTRSERRLEAVPGPLR
ncbi:type II toxin-antitoxin system VapC family toxin [Streptomyces sp. P1-3]|uniref:type II toxin-antitoxin system VapC family toxin n=1 Tax=Streptomyces sp. P1-3 TaxID=3421658 RepID=UPI003D367933